MGEKRPKRRKDKYNPYTIYKTPDGVCHIAFRDGQGVPHRLEISEELYHQFDQFELDDLSHLNVVDRHYEQSEQTEESVNERAFGKRESLEDEVLRRLENEALHKAISELPEKQRRRLALYYFEGMTYEQIAALEGCRYQTVQESIYGALKKLRGKGNTADHG